LNVGNYVIEQLHGIHLVCCIELELDIVTLESIEKNHKELINQTRAVLKKWKTEKCS
jgi:hypothetical protein